MQREDDIREAYHNLNRMLRDKRAQGRLTEPVLMHMMCAVKTLAWVLEMDDAGFSTLLHVVELWVQMQDATQPN